MLSRMVRFQEFGSPDVLHIEKVELRDPGPGEVRIKVAAIGMNFAEAMWRQNQYMETPRLPSGLGYEAAGVIDKLGAGVADFRIGEKVATLAGHSQGDYPAYGEFVIMPASSLVRYPANLSEVEAGVRLDGVPNRVLCASGTRASSGRSDGARHRGLVLHRPGGHPDSESGRRAGDRDHVHVRQGCRAPRSRRGCGGRNRIGSGLCGDATMLRDSLADSSKR